MSHFKFEILPKDELIQMQEEGIYQVRDVATIRDVSAKLQDAKIGYNCDGPEYILENFDTYFSILVHGKKLEQHIIDKGFEQILRSFRQFVQSLKIILDDETELDEEQQIKLCNILKMTIYIVSGFLTVYDDIQKAAENDVDLKKKGVRKRRDDEHNWTEEKHEVLVILYNCLRLPIHKLWNPPIPETEFTSFVANICYKTLEDPTIKNAKNIRETIFQILGTLIKEFNHGLDCPSRLIKLIQTYDFVVSSISDGVRILVEEYGCKSLISRLIKNIVEWNMSDAKNLTSSEIKQCSQFLVELATLLPDKMIPEIMYLGEQLDNDSYQFRMSILSIIAEVLIVLSGEGLSDDAKDQRDELLEILEDHWYDGNAFVRSKVLQLWGRLQQDQAIPLKRQYPVLKKVVERLKDKTMNVRKSAIGTMKIFLEYNPFASTLNIEEIKQKIEEETTKLKEIKQKLNSYEPSDEKKLHWIKIHVELREFIKEKVNGELDMSLPETQTRLGLQEACEQIEELIFNCNYEEAYQIVRLAEKQYNTGDHRKQMDPEAVADLLLEIFHSLFMQSGILVKENLSAEQVKELKEQQDKQEEVVSFFEASLNFATAFTEAADIIKKLLISKHIGECTEAINYFTAARNFSVHGSLDGVLDMLSLVYLKENDRKEAVAEAFKTMFLSSTAKSNRGHSAQIVKNLTTLIKNIKKGQYLALKSIIIDWVEKGDISNEVIQLLWERFTLKHPDTTEADSRAALLLLDIIAEAKVEVISANLPVVEAVLRNQGLNDFRVVTTISSMILKLEKTADTTGLKPPFKFNPGHEIIQALKNILTEGWNFNDDNYLTMSLKIIDVFYEVCDKPDSICEDILKEFYNTLYDPKNEEESIPVHFLIQFVTILGHIGARQLVFLDITIYKELKRRNKIQEEKDKKKNDKKLAKQRKRLTDNDSILSNVSKGSASLSRKQQNQVDEEQLAVEGAVADDADAEYVYNTLENTLLSEENLLGKLTSILISISQNLSKYKHNQVVVATIQAFTKMLTISQNYSESQIQLIFTILEKSNNEIIRSNIILALSDLIKRFPNLLEPWTPHMYKRLRDPSIKVRQTSILMLAHLIYHDQIRVKGNISEMAFCIIDPDTNIQNTAKHFFKQLSQKGNCLYNVMPDIISKLSDTTAEIDENQFKAIMKYLLDLIVKDKLIESLVSKICVRLRASTSPRQWRDLAYCLSILNYNEKSLRYLIENLQTFKEKLENPTVQNYFKNIANVLSKGNSNKPELKNLATQLSEKMETLLKIDIENGETEDNENRLTQDTNSTQSTAKTVNKKGRKPSTRKGKSKQNQSSSDESFSSDDSGNAKNPPASKSAKKPQLRQRKGSNASSVGGKQMDVSADDESVSSVRKSLRTNKKLRKS